MANRYLKQPTVRFAVQSKAGPKAAWKYVQRTFATVDGALDLFNLLDEGCGVYRIVRIEPDETVTVIQRN